MASNKNHSGICRISLLAGLIALISLVSSCGLMGNLTTNSKKPVDGFSNGKTYGDRCEDPSLRDPNVEKTAFYTVSGEKLDPFRAVGLVRLSGGGICSAVLVDGGKMVTAAHCFEKSTTVSTIEFIDSSLQSPVKISGSPPVLHPRYLEAIKNGRTLASDPTLANFDVAVITLKEKIIDRVPIKLYSGEPIKTGKVVALIGHGDAGRGSGIKRFAQSHVGRSIVSESSGSTTFSNLLLLDSATATGACPGDSGGGLFIKEGGSYLLVGVVNGVNDILYPGFPITSCSVCPQGLGIIATLAAHKEFLGKAGVAL